MKKILLFISVFLFLFTDINATGKKYEIDLGSIFLHQVNLGRKAEGVKKLTARLENKSGKKIRKVRLAIKFRDSEGKTGEKYVTIGTPTYFNIENGETKKIKTYLIVEKIDGRDFKIEIEEIIFE